MSVDIRLKGLEEALSALQGMENGIPKVVAQSINATVPKMKKEVRNKVNSSYHVTKGDIGKTLSTKRAAQGRLSAFIKSKGGPIALTKFKVTPKSPGTRRVAAAKVKRDGSGGTIPGAFIARMNSGHVGLMFRKGVGPYPIGQFYGPSVPSMLKSEKVSSYLSEFGSKELESALASSISAFIGGRS